MAKIPAHFREAIDECREKRLPALDLSWGGVEQDLVEILPEVFKFTWLRELDLSGNQLTSLPESIGSLSNLTQLDLSGNQLTSLPESIGSLSNLTQLNLSGNQLTSLPESISYLYHLTELYLSGNRLTSLPESIGSLYHLTELYLSANRLTSLPESIGSLYYLTSLGLSENRLANLPKSFVNLKRLTSLNLSDNDLGRLPLEVASRGIEAICEYFRQKWEAGEDTLYEAKLLIVGEGEAGKTTLARRIDDPNCPLPTLDESTEGIDVKEWHFNADNTKDFRVNIWDFGGQEILHSTHQFFLTKRSLYLLVIDSRKESPNLSYWLHIIELLSDNSPLILIKNEKNNYTANISESQLKGRFENIRDSISCNFADNRGLEEIVNAIKYQIQKLPHIGSTLPKTWIRVREELEKNERDYIALEEYLKICDNNEFKQEKDALQLSQYLHDIGVILHFQEDPLSFLYKTVILKPEWATQAVYKVIRSETVKQNLGKFTSQDLGHIWQAREYAGMRGELLELMIKFKLCYKLPNEPNTYIAPQLLNTNPLDEYEWNDCDNLILRYCYDFMPKGILSRFIVELHHLIDEPKVWRSGVILKKENTFAEVVETYDQKEIKIRLYGFNKRDLLTTITDKFDEIHKTYNRLIVNKLIPCNCSKCLHQQTPHFYRLEILKQFRSDRQETIQCQKSYQMVNVRGLIDDFESGIGGRNSPPSIDRVQLLQTLTVLIPANFNTLKFVINPPAGTVSPKDAPQAQRVIELLEWAESPTGCGLERIQEVLDEILNDR